MSNPIGEIKSLTDPSEWRFVPVVLNPADAATRSHLDDRAISAWWLEGPPFLYQEDSAWPQNLPWTLERAEMRGARTHLSDVVAETTVSFDWKTVQIAPDKVPTLIRLGDKYLNLVRRCQRETYLDKINRLELGKAIRPTSTLQPLKPFLGRALYPVLDKESEGQRNPSEEILRTLLFEVLGLSYCLRLPTTLLCPQCLKAKYEKGDFGERRLQIHQK